MVNIFMKITTIIYFLLSSFWSYSQYIEGTVLDTQTNKPIEGVHVFMKGINRGTLTNHKGNYHLKFPYKIVKSDTIRFSHVAYGILEIPFIASKNNYSIYLLKDVNTLKEIKVSNKINLKPSIKFNVLAEMKKGVYSFGSILKDEHIYVFGGDVSYEEDRFKKLIEFNPEISFKDFLRKGVNFSKESYSGAIQRYDINNNRWEKLNIKFRERAYHNAHLIDNKFYILGGKRSSISKKREYLDDKIEVLNLETNKIKIDDTNPHQAVDFASCVYKGNIIVMGGSISKNKLGVKQYSNTVHLYEVNSGFWYHLGNMPVSKEAQGVLVNDKFYLIGGYNKVPLSSIESYNLITGKWKKEGELFEGVSKPALANYEHMIYIFDADKIVTFNILTNVLNQYSIDLNLKEAKLYYFNHKLYILGGFNKTNYSFYPSRALYSIDIDEFNKTKIEKSKKIH